MSGSEYTPLVHGTSVDIQRTDGRVHSAFVSDINADKKSVTVEWCEKGESKGKEIELEAIYKLNPNIRHLEQHQEPAVVSAGDSVGRSYKPPTTDQPSSNGNGVHCPSDVSYVAAPASSTAAAAISRLVQPSFRLPTNSPRTGTVSGRGAYVQSFTNLQQQGNNLPTAPATQIPPSERQPHVTTTTTASNVAATPRSNYVKPVSEMLRPKLGGNYQQSSDPQPTVDSSSTTAVNNSPSTNGVNGVNGPRRSSCVKEIERIQQRREERRAAQRAAVRDNPLDLDPTNPAYEFAMMINEFRNTLDYRPLTNTDAVEDHQIVVCVRKRPMNKKECARKEIDVITVPSKQNIIIHEPKTKVDLTKYLENQQFNFDYAFDETSTNELVYRYAAQPLVECVFQRGMATCFAYGQTGSGKTHTMGGEFQSKGQQDCNTGIYALAASDVFRLNSTNYRHEMLIVYASFFEIYSGKVFDLLNKKAKLRVLEDARSQVQVVGLSEQPVESVDDVLALLQHGANIRTSGQTSANQHSSRSHAVFQLILKKSSGKLHGKFSLIDLAGNERGVDTSSSDRHTRMEGAEINKSLLALKECIRALGRRGAHLPFRTSKLTQVLRDSFIGDRSRTCMIAMISPGMASCEHTLNTLRYADRVKELGPATLSAGNSISDLGGVGAVTAGNKANIKAALDNNHISLRQQPTNAPSLATVGGDQLAATGDDLTTLRLVADEEMNEDMVNFHNVVNRIEEMEDECCEAHKELANNMLTWSKEHLNLYRYSNQVEYDVEHYISEVEMMMKSQVAQISNFLGKLANFRTELKREEELSGKLQPGRKF